MHGPLLHIVCCRHIRQGDPQAYIIKCNILSGDAETNIEFNLRLSENITNEHTYTDFNDEILQATEVAITTKPTNQGWFHHSKDHLLPAIEIRDYLLTILRNMNEEDTINFRLKLLQAQTCVTNLIALAKASWSAYQAEKFTT